VDNFFYVLRKKYHIDLDNNQKEVVRHIKGPALVLAGPGSGKTTVITARTFFLITECNINPDEILTLTFNRAAQREMDNRFAHIFGDWVSNKPKFSTFHSFCLSILRDYGKTRGCRFRLIEGLTGDNLPGRTVILKNIYEKINETAAGEEDIEILGNEIGYVKNKMITDFAGLSLKTREFEKIYAAYEKYKRENLYIDFDDMLTHCLAILDKCPDILLNCKKRYKYIQVDEGQDLSKIQFEILKRLFPPEEDNFLIVADDDQSIYGFRGAEPRYMFELGQYYKGLKIFRLENNYRSSANLVGLSSKFIKKNKIRFDKSHKTGNPPFADPVIKEAEDEYEQLKFIEENVKKHLSHGHTVAVLYRNNLTSVPIAEMLKRKGIPFVLRQNRVHFFRHWAVQDIAAFLRFSLDPYDYETFARIYYKLYPRITRAMMENALEKHGLPVIESLIRTNETDPFKITGLKDLMKKFGNLSEMRPLRALKYIEDEFRYFGNIRSYCDYKGVSVEYVYNLFGVLKTISSSCRSIPEFLALMDDLKMMFEDSINFTSNGNNPVSLITLHSAKGVEFDAVMMVDLVNREIPGENIIKNGTGKDENAVEEERRLFYVGMTRAKRWLYLVYPRYVNEMKEFRSAFVNEVVSILNEKLSDSIAEGRTIHHRNYGKGVISSVSRKHGATVIEVYFGGKIRSLDLYVCLENGIISL